MPSHRSGFRGHLAQQQSRATHVRFGSKADIGSPPVDVCFTPESGHGRLTIECPLCAISRHSTAFVRLPCHQYALATVSPANPKAYSISQFAMHLMLSCRAVTRIAAQSYKPTFSMSFRRLPKKDKIHVVTDLGLHSALGAIWASGACASTVSLGDNHAGKPRTTSRAVSAGKLRVKCDQRSRFPACRSQGRAAALVNRRGAFCTRYWSPS